MNAFGKVLIVEDEPDVAAVLCFAMEEAGAAEVRVATDGGVGLAVAREYRPDLILCDVMLPVMDGLGLAQAVRDQSPPLGAALVFVTAAPPSVFRSRPPEDYGALGVIRKPFDVDRLATEVRALLDGRKQRELEALLQELSGL